MNINLDTFNAGRILKDIAGRAKQRRLMRNLSQRGLSDLSGVSLGSVKRFEMCGEISMRSLIRIALVLQSTEEFLTLFSGEHYTTLDDIIEKRQELKRKRGRNNV